MRWVAALAVVLLAGCSSLPQGPPAASADKNFHLYVSNQSFRQPTADLQVQVDGATLFDGKAKVEGQHNWMLREANLTAGTHTVAAWERTTDTRATKTFTLPTGQERWVVVDYWYDDAEGSSISINVHEQQVLFD